MTVMLIRATAEWQGLRRVGRTVALAARAMANRLRPGVTARLDAAGDRAAPRRFRPATAADQRVIASLCKSSIAATYGPFMNPDLMRPWVEGQEVEDYVAGMWPRMTVAVRADTVLGVVAVEGQVIDLLWVRADLQRQGIGSALMDRAESIVAACHPTAELECFAPNQAGITFYQSRGYTAVRTYFETASGVDRVVMTKPLGGQAP
jgi:ribosomal protein S18 acetylase RimI-like enzyme